MLRTAEKILAARPATRFEVAAASETLAAEIRRMLQASPVLAEVTVGEAAATMQRARAGIVASGTATLEAAYFRLSFVLVYRVAWLTYLAARLLVRVKYLGMPNVLAGREIVPEFIQHRADPHAIARAVLELLNEDGVRARMVSEFDAIMGALGETGASAAAARAVLAELPQ
jgi:lipid-A-disaccharide synthase